MKFINTKQLKEMISFLEKDFKKVREKVQSAVNASPKSVILEDALKQIKKFRRVM